MNPTEHFEPSTHTELDWSYISSQLEEVIEHAQDLVTRCVDHSLTEGALTARVVDCMRHLNRSYNLRYPKRSAIDFESASRLAEELQADLLPRLD